MHRRSFLSTFRSRFSLDRGLIVNNSSKHNLLIMVSHEQYILRVTAGHSYDTSKHQDVLVNTEKPISISSEHLDAKVHIRVKDYRGAHDFLLISFSTLHSRSIECLLNRIDMSQAYRKAPHPPRPTSPHRTTPTTATRSASPSHPSATSPVRTSFSATTSHTRSVTVCHRSSTKPSES